MHRRRDPLESCPEQQQERHQDSRRSGAPESREQVGTRSAWEGHLKHRSILEYAKFRWFKLATALCALAGGAYLWHQPPTKPYGGTWLGYTLGTIGALLIVWLLWYGVRKRRYRSTAGSVQGWLSAHIYLGVALVVVVTLHTGFELGWNVHTLAYVLMVAVVASGIYGVFLYLRVPGLMTVAAGEQTPDSMLLRIADIDRALLEQALSLPDDLFGQVEKSVKDSRLGGSFRRIFTGRDPDCPTALAVRSMPVSAKRLRGEQALANKQVYTLLVEKDQLLGRARRALRLKAILDLWLYIHVPLSLALLAALVVHVLAVFIYW